MECLKKPYNGVKRGEIFELKNKLYSTYEEAVNGLKSLVKEFYAEDKIDTDYELHEKLSRKKEIYFQSKYWKVYIKHDN